MALPPLLSSIIGWLRAGYPEGLPQQDYIPLVALLGGQLSTDDVTAIADEIAKTGDAATAESIRRAIADIARVTAQDSDVARVRSRLAAGGWPLAAPQYLDRPTR